MCIIDLYRKKKSLTLYKYSFYNKTRKQKKKAIFFLSYNSSLFNNQINIL